MFISMVAVKATDSYEQHQAIWSLFPNTPDRRRDHLFRVETTGHLGQQMILLQSASQPQSSNSAQVLQTKPFNPQLQNEEFYKFKLMANPTKCLKPNKKVVEIKDENEQVQWLQRKLKGANVNVTAMESILVKNSKSFNSCFVCFEGILQVIDAEQVYQALAMGIGRKKHAGAGLLSLAKTA